MSGLREHGRLVKPERQPNAFAGVVLCVVVFLLGILANELSHHLTVAWR